MRALIFIFALGCAGGTRVNVVQSVDNTGGTVATNDGTNVQIPSGAVTTQTMITIESVNVSLPDGVVQVGPAYDFGPEGATFSTPVTISLPFDTSKIPSGRTANDVRVFTAARGSNQFTTLVTTIESGVIAKTNTTHFTTFVPAVAKPNVEGGCTPMCSVQTGVGCRCSGSCGGKMFVLQCSEGDGAAFCTCTVDGSPLDTSIQIRACDFESEKIAFMTKCAGALP